MLCSDEPTGVSSPIRESENLVSCVRAMISRSRRCPITDPAQLPVINCAYLDGRRGPQFEQRVGWDVLGVEFRIIMDFGCGISDYRGTYLNAGA
jgi:hypothetical protein